MSHVSNSKIGRILVTVTFVIAVVWTWASYAEDPASDANGSEDPNIPLLVGTWEIAVEFFESTRFTPGTHGTGQFTFVITEQIGNVFTGYAFSDPEDDHGSLHGAIIANSVRIGGDDLTMTGMYDPNRVEITGSYNNIPVHLFNDYDYETGVFRARRQVDSAP